MRLGQTQVLTIVKKVDFGVYLGSDEERVLLPKKQVPEGCEIGDPVEVFLYKDSDDRPIATTNKPRVELGELAVLTVADVGRMGAFLDWGLEKDLFLPFKQQNGKVTKGQQVLVSLYIDKSERLCATMKVYPMLRTDSPYKKDDIVEGFVYDTSDEFGVFVAVDSQFSALIPKKEVYGKLSIGHKVQARVTEVKPDGKLNLSVRDKIPMQMNQDAELVLEALEKHGGKLPFSDKADPEIIKSELGLSKNAFKRAVGKLYKEQKVAIGADSIVLKSTKER